MMREAPMPSDRADEAMFDDGLPYFQHREGSLQFAWSPQAKPVGSPWSPLADDPSLQGILSTKDPLTLSYLACHSRTEVRRLVATNPDTPPEALDWLSRDRAAVARHPHASEEALITLADDDQDEVRLAATLNMVLPSECVAWLSWDSNPLIRARAAQHPRLPPASLNRLAEDLDAAVRAAVACAKNASPAVLVKLAQDPKPLVRFAVACHPRLPEEARELLAHDPLASIAERAANALAR